MTSEPEITIGIPCRNGGEILRRALAQVFSQETSRAFEVIALDSGSTDGTLEALAAYPVRVIAIEQSHFDWGRVRERLFEEARGAIVVNLSQDAIPAEHDWLERLIAPLLESDAGVSCGCSIPDPDRHFPQFQWEKNGYYYFTREIGKFTAKYGRGLSFANTAVRRNVWESLRVDPQATGEDFGFQIKLHRAGVKIAFPADAPVLHHHYYSLKGVYRRCRNEGLALREMGCAYTEADLVADLISPRKYVQWLREVKRGSLRSGAEWLYPALRPVAVYMGSRFARKMVWY
jgi:rhamnosyltransferase